MSTITNKPIGFKMTWKEFWDKIRANRKAAYNVAEETKDAGEDFTTRLTNSFHEMVAYLFFTLIGALMIFYVAGYPGGLVGLLAAILKTFLPSVPFESAWVSLGIGIYILTSFGIVFVRMVLQASITTREEIIIERLDQIDEEVNEIVFGKDLLTETMANLSDKLDEHKLHL